MKKLIAIIGVIIGFHYPRFMLFFFISLLSVHNVFILGFSSSSARRDSDPTDTHILVKTRKEKNDYYIDSQYFVVQNYQQ